MSEMNSPPPLSSDASNFAGAYTTAPGAFAGAAPTADEKNMAMLIYLLGIFTHFIGPLVIWLVKKDQSQFIDDQGKEVLNFQITAFVASFIAGLSVFILIGILLVPAVMIAYLVLMVMGLLKAKEGIAYRFPFAVRLLK